MTIQHDPAEREDAPADADRPTLNELVFEALERLDEEGEGAIVSLCTAHPDHAIDLRRRLDELRAAGLLADGRGEDPDEAHIEERAVGAYSLGELLGRGGMGLVFSSEDPLLGGPLAIKLIRPEFVSSDVVRKRFLREARAAARLRHPAILPIRLVAESRGTAYIVLDRVYGCTLEEALRSLEGRTPASLTGADLADAVRDLAPEGAAGTSSPSPLFRGSWSEVCARIARELAEALQHAHAAGVLHRDVKPSNVMITPAGRVALMDFGLAHLDDGESLTRPGSQIGSLPYSPPERIRGACSPDASGDVYGLGVLLYELLTLRLPFTASSQADLVTAIRTSTLVPLESVNGNVPRDLVRICSWAMAASPRDRYEELGSMADDLSSFLSRNPVVGRSASLSSLARRTWRARPGLCAAVAVAVVALMLGPPALVRREAAGVRASAAVHALADEHLVDALSAVATMRTALDASSLTGSTALLGLRSRLLERADSMYVSIGGAESIVGRAEVQLELGHAAEAIRMIEAELAPGDPISSELLGRANLVLGRALARSGEPERALDALESGLSILAQDHSDAALIAARLHLERALLHSGPARLADLRSAEGIARRCMRTAGSASEDAAFVRVAALEELAVSETSYAAREEHLSVASEIGHDLAQHGGDRVRGLLVVVSVEQRRAELDARRGDDERAVEHLQVATNALRRLADAFPGSTVHGRRYVASEIDLIEAIARSNAGVPKARQRLDALRTAMATRSFDAEARSELECEIDRVRATLVPEGPSDE